MLVDTQAVVWSSFEPARISKRATAALVEARQSGVGLSIADITLWEIAMLVTRGKVEIPSSLNTYLRQIEERFTVLALGGEVAERSMAFSAAYPGDPADRLIGATALVHNLQLVTADDRIRRSGEVPCIW